MSVYKELSVSRMAFKINIAINLSHDSSLIKNVIVGVCVCDSTIQVTNGKWRERVEKSIDLRAPQGVVVWNVLDSS